MKRSAIIYFLLAACTQVFAQPVTDNKRVREVISAVQRAQQSLRTVEYSLLRTDTLLSGDTRTMTGKVRIVVVPRDTIFGFHFYSKQAGDNSEQVYDGHLAYVTDMDKKQYQISTTPDGFARLRGTGGGRLLVPDVVKLDTSKASKLILTEDDKYYHIAIHRPDLVEYDVANRRKIVTIDKSNMLPLAVREHQESYGKSQDLYYQITALAINERVNYPFSTPPFLKEYSLVNPIKTAQPMLTLVDKEAPAFELISFDGKTVNSTQFKGKTVLLDLWEIWCGPCIIAMPKVQALYEKYKGRGLEVYGIVNDLKQLDPAKAFVKSRKITFPVLTGNLKFKNDYKFDGGVPMYILIGKDGKISWLSFGATALLEEAIVGALQ